MSPASLVLLAACTPAADSPVQSDSAEDSDADSAADTADTAGVDACPGAPSVYIYWYPRDGLDIFEIAVEPPGSYALGLSSLDWQGEACGPASEDATCHHLEETLALQTVETIEEVVIDAATWFTQARFDAWAVYYGDQDPDTGEGVGRSCVGFGYPGCCTRDSGP